MPADPSDLRHHRCICFATRNVPNGYPRRFKQGHEEIEMTLSGRVLVNGMDEKANVLIIADHSQAFGFEMLSVLLQINLTAIADGEYMPSLHLLLAKD